MLRPVVAFLCLASGLTAAWSAPTRHDLLSLSNEEQRAVQQSLDRGAELYRYDQSAWHLSDAAMAVLPADSAPLVRGWITTPAPGGLRTTFFGEAEGQYFVLYSAIWTGRSVANSRVYLAAERHPVSDEERRLIFARKAALENQTQFNMCNSARPNVIVIPGSAATVHVYVMTPQISEDVYPMGGHHRIDVTDGRVVSQRSFTNVCIDVPQDRAGGGPAGLVVTHLLDPVPTEIHVFSAFATQVPIFVGMKDGRIFAVEVNGDVAKAEIVSH